MLKEKKTRRYVSAEAVIALALLFCGCAGSHVVSNPDVAFRFSTDHAAHAAVVKTKHNQAEAWSAGAPYCVATAKGHEHRVGSVAFSPVGSILASGSFDGTIKLWNTDVRLCIATLSGHTDGIWSVAFSPDGTLLASAGRDNTIRLWDVEARLCAATLSGHTGTVFSVAFSPDGKLLASGSEDNSIMVWDVTTRQCVVTLSGHSAYVRSVAFSPDGSLLASGSWDDTIKLWDMGTRRPVAALSQPGDWIRSIAFSPDGKVLASASDSRIIRLWDVGTRQCVAALSGHTSYAVAVSFSPDGSLLASSSDDNTIKLWDVEAGQCVGTLSGHTADVRSVAFSPDGKLLASGSDDNTINLWECAQPAAFSIGDQAIDWAHGTPALGPYARVEAGATSRSGRIEGKDEIGIEVAVSNTGKGDLYQLYALTGSDVASWDSRPLLFGKIAPRERKRRVLRHPMPEEPAGETRVEFTFKELNGNQPETVVVVFNPVALEGPSLVWTWDVLDNPEASAKVVGNDDGVVQKGEAVDIEFIVKNTGKEPAQAVRLEVGLPKHESLTVYGDTTLDFGDIRPGKQATRSVNVQVKRWSSLEELPLTVRLTEEACSLSRKGKTRLAFDTRKPVRSWRIDRRMWVNDDETVLRTGASEDASEFARAEKNYYLRAVREQPGWIRVEYALPDGRIEPLWVVASSLTTKPPAAAPGKTTVTRFGNQPPVIMFAKPSHDLTTTDERIALSITVKDLDGKIKDVTVRTATPDGKRSIDVVAKSGAPTTQGDERVVDHMLELTMGANIVRVTAIDDKNRSATRIRTITRVPKRGTTHLIAVGINTYPEGYELKCARKDAEDFYAFALKNMGINQTNAALFVDEAATRAALMEKFGEIRLAARQEDSVIIFLAGHGMIQKDEKYFVPAKAKLHNLFGTAVGMDEFARILKMDAERVLVIADACYSGDIIIRGTHDMFEGIGGKGRILIGYEGAARENAKLGYGYLTHYFIEALEGAGDANRDGKITLLEAYEYAAEKIRKLTGTGLWIKGEGDLDLITGIKH